MIYIGIDPGASGGIGIIDTSEGAEAYVYTDDTLIDLLYQHNTIFNKIRVMVEQVNAFPGERGQFNFGVNYGTIFGILKALRIPFELATPRKWKKEFSLDSDKQKSIDCCKRLFPLVDLRKTERSRTDHDGKAEALLIAEYARRHMK